MRFATGISALTTVALLACGSVSAAQATVEETPAPSEPVPTSGTATTDIEQQPSDEGSEGASGSEAMPMQCTATVQDTTVTVQFPEHIPYNDITVTMNGQPIPSPEVNAAEVVVDHADATGPININLWDDNQLSGECTVTVPDPAPTDPEPTEPEPTEPEPTEPEPTEPEPTEPEPTEPEEPTQTPDPSPGQTDSPSPTPGPSSPSPSSPLPTQSEPGPSWTADPTTPPQPAPDSQRPTNDEPTPSFGTGAAQPSMQEPRIIRQFSDNPRYLLPHLFGTDSQDGSRLIMPRPRETEDQAPDLETLPPVSEEELNAIKARLSSPDRAGQPSGGDVRGADIDTRRSERNSWWVFSGVTGLVGVGTALWWATTRRKRKH